MGSGFNNYVRCMTVLPTGELLVGGWFGGPAGTFVARWTGLGWSALAGNFNQEIDCMLALPNGDLVVGGNFTNAGGVPANRIARWNGATWSALGSGLSERAAALAALPNGELVVGGSFTFAGGMWAPYIARWNGLSWSPFGSGANHLVECFTVLPGGDLAAGGLFSSIGGIAVSRAARWNGWTWSPLGPGVGEWNGSGSGGGVRSFTVLPDGELVIGGNFMIAGGNVSPLVARFVTTCPAQSTSYGVGCQSVGGPGAFTVTSLPWIGATYEAQTTGVPSTAIALSVIGWTAIAVPMPLVLPQGVAGCTALVSPDWLDVLLPTGGNVTVRIAIPDSLAVVGQQFKHQIAPLDFDLQGNLTALTATNALALTIGSF
jgi:hypothetical protein